MQDVTSQRDLEQRLRTSEERQAFLLQLSDALRPLSDPGDIQDVAARTLGEQLGADRAYYAYLEGDCEIAVIEREYLRGDAPRVVGRHRLADFECVSRMYRAGKTASALFAPVAARLATLIRAAGIPLTFGGYEGSTSIIISASSFDVNDIPAL